MVKGRLDTLIGEGLIDEIKRVKRLKDDNGRREMNQSLLSVI